MDFPSMSGLNLRPLAQIVEVIFHIEATFEATSCANSAKKEQSRAGAIKSAQDQNARGIRLFRPQIQKSPQIKDLRVYVRGGRRVCRTSAPCGRFRLAWHFVCHFVCHFDQMPPIAGVKLFSTIWRVLVSKSVMILASQKNPSRFRPDGAGNCRLAMRRASVDREKP